VKIVPLGEKLMYKPQTRVILALVSGGIDSTTAALHAKKQYCDLPRRDGADIVCYLYAVSFIYGQTHSREVEAARKFAEKYGFKHFVVSIGSLSAKDLGLASSGSALTGDKPIPETVASGRVPETYVPQRNMVLLAHAASILEMLLSAHDAYLGVLVVGFHAEDSAPGEPVYPDTRKEFVDAVELALNIGSGRVYEGRSRVVVHAPWVELPKWKIIVWGVENGMDYSITWTCYRGGEKPCGKCPSCLHRLRSFVAAGIPDPLTEQYEYLPDWYKQWLDDDRTCREGDVDACKRVEKAKILARRGEIPYLTPKQ